MKRTGARHGLPALCGAMLVAAPAAAREETQIWLVQSASTRLGSETVMTLDASERFLDSAQAHHQYLGRVTLNRRVAKGIEIGGGFTWSQTGRVNEYRPFAEATLSSGRLAVRSRIEARMFDFADRTVWRLRERAQLSFPLDGKKRWTMVLNGEGFFNLNSANVARQTGLTQVRTLAGVRHALSERVSLTLSYQRQQTLVRSGKDLVTHQPILALAARF